MRDELAVQQIETIAQDNDSDEESKDSCVLDHFIS